jgi:hypothetical protein
VRDKAIGLLLRLFVPSDLFHPAMEPAMDALTLRGQAYVRSAVKVAIGLFGLLLSAIAIVLAAPATWPEIAAGALLAWGVSMIVWARSQYVNDIEVPKDSLRETAETDLLHARLNQIAKRVGAPSIAIDYELEHAIAARQDRLAHYAGLFELGGNHGAEDDNFWDEGALGE